MHRIRLQRPGASTHRTRAGAAGRKLRPALLAGLALGLGACQSPCSQDGFNRQLVGCASAIQAGDLEQAQSRLEIAERCAGGEAQRVKVRSLRGVILGARAMEQGDVAGAREHWSRIEHSVLRVELSAAAARMDLSLADAPVVLTKE